MNHHLGVPVWRRLGRGSIFRVRHFAGYVAALSIWIAGACQVACAQQLLLESFQESAGLRSLAVLCLAQGQDGAVWICTENGLYRHDGFRIHRVALPEGAGAFVSSVLADVDDGLWVSTRAGVYVREGRSPKTSWQPILGDHGEPLLLEPGQRMSRVGEREVVLADTSSRLWTVSRSNGRWAATRSDELESDDLFRPMNGTSIPVSALASGVWFGCGRRLCQRSGGQLMVWDEARGVPAQEWANVIQGRDGGIWARSASALIRLDRGGQRFKSIPSPGTPPKLWQESMPLVEDQQGRILTSYSDGIARWDGQEWERWTTAEGLPETAIRSLLVDGEGTVWFGTSGRGLHRWTGYGVLQHWTVKQGLPSPVVWGFARDSQGDFWVATGRGVAVLDKRARRLIPIQVPEIDGAAPVTTLCVGPDGDAVWLQDRHLVRGRAGQRTARAVLHDETFLRVACGAGNAVYVATTTAVARVRDENGGLGLQWLAVGLPNGRERVRKVVSRGTVDWFVTQQGVYRVESGQWQPLLTNDGKPLVVQRQAIFAEPDDLWVVGLNGLMHYRMKAGVATSGMPDREWPGADSPNVVAMATDPQGRPWLGTDRGLYTRERGGWRIVDRRAGLIWNDVDEGALLFESIGRVWVGTSAGITEISSLSLFAPVPSLRLEEVKFGGGVEIGPDFGDISWDRRDLTLRLGTRAYSQAAAMQIEYRLDTEEGWQPTQGSMFTLAALGVGQHRLEIRARSELWVNEATAPLALTFTIVPPWWRSPMAIVVYVLAGLALWFVVLWAVYERSRRQRALLEQAVRDRTEELNASHRALAELAEHNAHAMEDERRSVARELHDELGQQLAALRMEVSVLEAYVEPAKNRALAEQWHLLHERVDQLVIGTRALVARLRPSALDAGLAAGIEWLAANLTRAHGVACYLRLDPVAERLDADTSALVFRIVQEAFTNVAKHAAASRVDVSLSMESDHWHLCIADNGRGFDSAQPTSGFGLRSMGERARLLGGELLAHPSPDGGAMLEVVFPAAGASSAA